jgi:hypothetical protein
LGSPLGILADGPYRAKAEAITDGSGFFSAVIGNLTGCWVISNLDPGSLHLVFAEVTAGGVAHSANGSWTAEYFAAHSAFSYNLSGALTTVHLTYSDEVRLRGAWVICHIHQRDRHRLLLSERRSGNCLLWVPYTTMERVDYIARNWSLSIFSNLSGSPSEIPSFLPFSDTFHDAIRSIPHA